MTHVLAILLAGGAGERLYPLTRDTAKPAVPFGGAYRILDFTLSNCINSDIRRIFVLTQYKSLDLTRHVRDGWNILSPEMGEYIEVIPPMKRVGDDCLSSAIACLNGFGCGIKPGEVLPADFDDTLGQCRPEERFRDGAAQLLKA